MGHLDPDLALRAGVEPHLPQFFEEPVAVGDPRGLDVNHVRHLAIICRAARRSKLAIVRAVAVATEREYGLHIGGESVEPASGEIRDLTEPATGAPLARAAMAGEADVDRAVAAAREALDGAWAKTPPTERSRLLHALADAIVANRKELAELESRNVGKAISSVKAEVNQAVENFRFYASAIASIAGRSTPVGGSLLFYSLKEPVGVAAQIVPWNYPLTMATWKLAPALAAGCTVVLKPDPADAADGAAACRAGGGGRLPAGCRERRARATARRRARTSSATRASTRWHSPARRRPAARSCGCAPSRSSG